MKDYKYLIGRYDTSANVGDIIRLGMSYDCPLLDDALYFLEQRRKPLNLMNVSAAMEILSQTARGNRYGDHYWTTKIDRSPDDEAKCDIVLIACEDFFRITFTEIYEFGAVSSGAIDRDYAKIELTDEDPDSATAIQLIEIVRGTDSWSPEEYRESWGVTSFYEELEGFHESKAKFQKLAQSLYGSLERGLQDRIEYIRNQHTSRRTHAEIDEIKKVLDYLAD